MMWNALTDEQRVVWTSVLTEIGIDASSVVDGRPKLTRMIDGSGAVEFQEIDHGHGLDLEIVDRRRLLTPDQLTRLEAEF